MTLIVIATLTACSSHFEASRNEPSRGIWGNDTYTNQYLGLTFRLPEEWTITCDDDISALLGLSSDEDEFIEPGEYVPYYYWEGNPVFIDMIANDPFLGVGIIIMYEQLTFPYGGVSEPEHIKNTLEYIANTNMSAYTVDDTVQIGKYLWYSYINKIMTREGVVVMRNFINIQGNIVRTISFTYNEVIDPVDDLLGYFTTVKQ